MRIQSAPGTLKRLRRTAGTFFQRTFETPRDRLPAFVASLLAGDSPILSASITVQAVVSPPDHLESLLASHHLALPPGADWSITAAGQQESQALLTAALGDAVDFYSLPDPKRFLLFADHDEYTTLFAARKGTLSRLAGTLAAGRVAEVSDYVRRV